MFQVVKHSTRNNAKLHFLHAVAAALSLLQLCLSTMSMFCTVWSCVVFILCLYSHVHSPAALRVPHSQALCMHLFDSHVCVSRRTTFLAGVHNQLQFVLDVRDAYDLQ